MRKFSLGVTLCLSILFLALLAGDAFAQGTPSSKATAAINTSVACVEGHVKYRRSSSG